MPKSKRIRIVKVGRSPLISTLISRIFLLLLIHKTKGYAPVKAHTLVVSNSFMATAIILVSQNLFYEQLPDVSLFCLVSGGYLFSRPRLPQCGMVVQRRRRSSNSLPYWISCSLHRPPDALTVDPITSPWLFDLARKYLLIKDQRKTPCAAWCFSLVSGGYLFSRAVTSQVSSAYKGLTSVFGMGTGGSP